MIKFPIRTIVPGRAAWLTPERRATNFYFSIFMGSGAATAYGGIWFKDQGLDAGQIGIIGSLPVFIILLINVFVGRLADRASDWRQVITIGAVLSGVITIALFFSHGFLPILLIWTLATGRPTSSILRSMPRRCG